MTARVRRPLAWLSPAARLGLLYWSVAVVLALPPRLSGNVWSRYLTIESLVERGTLAVDESPLLAPSGTPDLVRFDGRLYSDKPPVLSTLGAAVYAPLFLAGFTLAGSLSGLVLVNWVLVAIFAAGSAAVTLIALRHLLAHVSLPSREADLLTVAFGGSSLLLPYAVTFNNHVAASALITSAFALVALEASDRRSQSWRQLCAGALAGLASVVDLPAGGAVLIALGMWLWLRGGGGPLPWRYVIGALPPLLLHVAVQAMVTGTVLPAEMYPDAFAYPGSYWTTSVAAIRQVPRWQFALEFLAGPSGWLTLTPALALGLVAIVGAAARSGDRLRPAAIVVASVTAAVALYYVGLTRRTDFAGQSYGTRHLLAISPLVYFFSCVLLSRTPSRAVRALFAVLTLVGFVYAVYGMYDPWTRVEARRDPPLLLLQRFVPYPWSSYSR